MRAYQQTFQLMMTQNKDAFDSFKKLHDAYAEEPDFWKAKFNEEGRDILDIIRNYERKLCSTTESGQFSKFSTGLSAKFWEEIRKVYPKIDFVGIL